MKRVLVHLRLTVLYLAQMVKAKLHYRGDFLTGCAASLLSQATGLAVVGVIFATVPRLRGWSRPEVFFIYGFALTAQAIFEAFADAFYWFADKYVNRGELDRVLLRPLDPLFQIFLENLNLEFLPDLALGLSILAASAKSLGLALTAGGLLLGIVMLASAVAVLAGLFLALASCSFWAEDKVGILPPIYNLMAFGRYPIDIYGRALRVILTGVIPFAFVAFYPSSGLLGRGEYAAYFWATPLAGAASATVGYLVWRAGLRRYQSTGS